MQEKSENFNSLRPILFELCKKKNYKGGVKLTPPPAGIGLSKVTDFNFLLDRKFSLAGDLNYFLTKLS